MGHIKTTEEGEKKKKLYYSHQCQLVWHAAVSTTLLPIHKKIFSSQGVSMNNITSQTTHPHACPVTYGNRTHGDTEEPGDSRITTTITLCCRKPACGAKKTASHTRHSAHTDMRPETKAYACPQAHMYSQSRPLPPLHHPFSLSSHLV